MRFRPKYHPTFLLTLLLGCCFVLLLPGCGDDESAEADADKNAEAAETKKKEELPPVVFTPTRTLLSPVPQEVKDAKTFSKVPQTPLVVKPGHWTATVQNMKANYEDFVGQITSTIVDENNNPVRLAPTNFSLESTRPVALAKGLPKRIQSEVFVPLESKNKSLQTILRNTETGSWVEPQSLQIQSMPSYQYNFVVYAKEASRYGYLKVTDSITAPWEEEFDESPEAYYRVTLLEPGSGALLPDSMLCWTSIAYLLWDEVDPSSLSKAQQQALVDWIHWGGRLIISGPDSLDLLRGSFLEEFLPADKSSTRKFDTDDLADFSNSWTQRSDGITLSPLMPLQPWSGVELEAKPNATSMKGNLLFQKNVGIGSIVVSAIQLSERDLINWPGFDCFLNAAILQRPRRNFAEGPYGGLRSSWADHEKRRLDAHFTTGMRLFARDAAEVANVKVTTVEATDFFGQVVNEEKQEVDRPGGVASWNNFGPGSTLARESLTSAAAVEIPGPGFVVACLAIYLLVLVPLNWSVFRSLGHVEWAWIAAPFIAIMGTFAIVRFAQLDIGFVRSQTEIALLELQSPYERGLLSRYTAIYSSLSTTYDITYDDPSTLAIPFPPAKKDEFKLGDRIWNVSYSQQRTAKLSGLAVPSASARMVLSEQMFELEGALRLGTSSQGHKQIENWTGFPLRDLAVIERTFDSQGKPKYKGAWIGDLRSQNSSVLGLTPIYLEKDEIPFAEEREIAASTSYRERLDIKSMLQLAFTFPGKNDPRNKELEEVRAIGIIDEVLPGTEVNPTFSQVKGTTIVLAHLKYENNFTPQPDLNSRGDVVKPNTKNKE